MTSTATTTQLGSADVHPLDHEIYLLSPAFSEGGPIFHDAVEDLPEAKLSFLDRLPASFQELLLLSVDSETFFSLSLLNRHWRRRSASVPLYAHHLAKCTAVSDDDQRNKWSEYSSQDLSQLRRLFVQEAKRNLFASYSYGRSTYRLVAPPTCSASAVPHGEAFGFFFSSNGTKLAVTSSSRLFIIDLSTECPEVKAAFTLQRRPTAVEICNEGRLICMLSPEWRISTFTVGESAVRLIDTFLLDEPATALTVSPDGSLLVASQIGGIEFFSLEHNDGTVPRRKLACEPVTSLKFAQNSSVLLGTNARSPNTTTTLVHAPPHLTETYSEDGSIISTATIWLSQPLFPSSFGATTHAALLPGGLETRILAYDAPAENFGILDHQKMKFTQSILHADRDQVMSAVSTPSLTDDARLATIPICGLGFQIAGLPLEGITAINTSQQSLPRLEQSCMYSNTCGKPAQRWFPAREKALIAHWVSTRGIAASQMGQRLVVAGSDDIAGKGREGSLSDEAQDSGVLHYVDFGFSINAPDHRMSIIDLSEVQVQRLEEGTTEDDAELALARQSLSSRASDKPRNAPLARSVTSARHRRRSAEKKKGLESTDLDEVAPEERHLDAPYVPSEPRPQGTLQRNRTARAAYRERPQSMPLEPRMRDPRGRGEIPDESDADGWVLPPPVYAQEPDLELPDELKQTLRPPTPPPRSPKRRSASTPNLLPTQLSSAAASRVEVSSSAAIEPRPQAQRRRTFVESARKSVMFGREGLRRITSSPLDVLTRKGKKGESGDILEDTTNRISSPSGGEGRPSSVPKPRPVSTLPASQARRRSFLARPLSLHTNLRENDQVAAQLVDETSAVSKPSPAAPESPTLPSPAQVASLHRRQASGSISSMRSDQMPAPRAATGAHRRGTNSMSPWNSTLMLNSLPESSAGATASSRPVSMAMNGSPGPSRPMSMHMNGSSANTERKATLQENSMAQNRPPTRLQEASMETSRASSRGKTSGSDRRKSFMGQPSKLSAIPSMASLKAFASNQIKKADKSPNRAAVKRSGSQKLQRSGSVKKRGSANKGKKSMREKLGWFGEKVMKNLESV